jgi:hypothetical protein
LLKELRRNPPERMSPCKTEQLPFEVIASEVDQASKASVATELSWGVATLVLDNSRYLSGDSADLYMLTLAYTHSRITFLSHTHRYHEIYSCERPGAAQNITRRYTYLEEYNIIVHHTDDTTKINH